MHSSANKVKLPCIEDIERLHSEVLPEPEEEVKVDIDAIIDEAQKQCDRMIADAKERAEHIIEQAKADGEIIRDNKAKEGYDVGKARGEEEMERALTEHNEEFARQIHALANYREQMFVSLKEHLIDCLKLLARKIILREYSENDSVINEMIDHYYGMIKDRTNLVLRVSREDYNKINLQTLENRGVEIKVDDTFSHGDLVISCDAEGINFGLNEQLDKIEGSIGV